MIRRGHIRKGTSVHGNTNLCAKNDTNNYLAHDIIANLDNKADYQKPAPFTNPTPPPNFNALI